jgi:phosphopantothenoylcysteine decarboxylase/phosphopantothenate--cysteine ligase
MLSGKNIIVGITGSIAAYKAAFLVRLLVKAGASVKVVMTPCAEEFITTLTLSTLSKNPVTTSFKNQDGTWNNHVEAGLWADAMVVAPATANTLANMANGLCDSVLLATYLSARCPVFVAPAMDLDMLKHPSTQNNFKLLKSHGVNIINPESGELASGLTGEGRMAEPETIVGHLLKFLQAPLPLKGKRVLVTAGPTYEAIDPVRFIGNHSSGKMGFAIAEELASQGAQVILVTGPVQLSVRNINIQRIDVQTADEMYVACMENFPECDVAVLAAAVADYVPVHMATDKIKKTNETWALDLKSTKDILLELGKKKTAHQILVGFALETNNEIENAKIKITNKNLDFIVLNSLNDIGAGFKVDTNKITILDKFNNTIPYPLLSKSESAKNIVSKITDLLESIGLNHL